MRSGSSLLHLLLSLPREVEKDKTLDSLFKDRVGVNFNFLIALFLKVKLLKVNSSNHVTSQ